METQSSYLHLWMRTLTELFEKDVIDCTACPRLRDYLLSVAQEKRAAYKDQTYWGRPVPTLLPPEGPSAVRLLVVGLAPSAHGANRTGRMVTGDRSGDWLYRALHKFGFCTQPLSVSKDDGLALIDCAVTCTVRCAPPQNKPLPAEFQNCKAHGLRLLASLPSLQLVVALGSIAFKETQKWLGSQALVKFAHLQSAKVGGVEIIATYHPSQQNTFTGVLTEPQFDRVFQRARGLLDES